MYPFAAIFKGVCDMKISRGIKKVLLLVLALSLAIGMFSLPATVTADSSDDSGVFDVYHPSYGVACYPRMFTTSKGSVLCAFDTNDEGGRGKIKLTRSSDNGKTWTKTPITVGAVDNLDCANAAFIEFGGQLLCAYRANALNNGYYTSEIRVSKSTDDGYTWSEHSIVDSATTAVSDASECGGIYEPYFMVLDGKLRIYFASDRIGKSVSSMAAQNIEMMTYDPETNSWGDLYVCLNGTTHRSRDGMAVIDKFADGSGYAMVIEATNFSGRPFVIQLYTSPDGFNWTFRQNVYVPDKKGKKAGAPYIKTLRDGRMAISFQTDQDAAGNGDGVSYMATVFSKTALSINSEFDEDTFTRPALPFYTPDGCYSVWNSVEVSGDYFLEFSSVNYPYNSARVRRTKISEIGKGKKFDRSFTLSDCTDLSSWGVGYSGATMFQNQNYSSTTQPSDYIDFYSNGNNGLAMYLSFEKIDPRGIDFSNVKYIEFDMWMTNGDMFSKSDLRRISISSQDFNHSQLKNGGDAYGDYAAQLPDSVLNTPLQSHAWNHIKIPVEGYANSSGNPIDITSVKKLCIQAYEVYDASFVACISNVTATVDDTKYRIASHDEQSLVIPASFGEYTYSADVTINDNYEGNSFIAFTMNDYWSTRFLLWDKSGNDFWYTGQFGLTSETQGREPASVTEALAWSPQNNKVHVDIKVNGDYYEMYINGRKKHSFKGNYVQTLSVTVANCDVTFTDCRLDKGYFKPGDANRNGVVDIGDALLTLQHTVKALKFSPALQLSCDVNNSGDVSALDALIILRRSVGLLDKFDNE